MKYFTMMLTVCAFPAFAGSVDIVGNVADRKSTRLNSSHGYISYAVFCLKKKKKPQKKKKKTSRNIRPDETTHNK